MSNVSMPYTLKKPDKVYIGTKGYWYVGAIEKGSKNRNALFYLRPDLTVQYSTGYTQGFNHDETGLNIGYWNTREEAEKARKAYKDKYKKKD